VHWKVEVGPPNLEHGAQRGWLRWPHWPAVYRPAQPFPRGISALFCDQKRIEAQGIYDYNHVVSSSLSPPVLEFERIEQLNKLAASANAKTIVIGERQSGTPLLLSTPSGSH
jgi:hypothetical protein